MKNDRLLTFSILGFVTLMHVALFALLMFLNPLSLPPTIQDMEFVDLAGLGLPGGGGGGETETAAGTARTSQTGRAAQAGKNQAQTRG